MTEVVSPDRRAAGSRGEDPVLVRCPRLGVGLRETASTAKGPHMARTVREQQDKRREEKLKQVQEQVDDGSLVIRKMTKQERKANPPKPRPKDKRKKR